MINGMQKIFRLWLVILLMIATTHQVMEKLLHIRIPVIDNYLDPLLLMPILLHLLLWEQRILFKKRTDFTFSTLQLIMIFIVVSFITEYLFPKWNPKFTGDIWDIICYGIGTFSFALIINRPGQNKILLKYKQ